MSVWNAGQFNPNNYVGKTYDGGCQEFVAKVIGKLPKNTENWIKGDKVGKSPYTENGGLSVGDIVGYPGHVAIFIGGGQFIACPYPNGKVRIQQFAKDQELFKYGY